VFRFFDKVDGLEGAEGLSFVCGNDFDYWGCAAGGELGLLNA
jgi:hypothetical protein